MKRKQVVKPKFKVGDRVRVLHFGNGRSDAEVVGRGEHPVGGEWVYNVNIFMDPDDPMPGYRPEGGLELLPSPEPRGTIDLDAAIRYLKVGGLLLILGNGWGVVRDRPRAWLRPNSRGNLTHTLYEDRGWLGGGFIPLRASDDGKILPSKRDEVAAFLRTFGLDDAQVEDILKTVGVKRRG